jgi:CheY-like chemotaxis protein
METCNGTVRKRHVLILDDDIELAWAFKQTLEQLGYDATIVPDGALALKFAAGHLLDAIVCDLQTRRLEGDLLFAAVARLSPFLARRFVFIAAETDELRLEKFFAGGELSVLRKPVAVENLLGEVVRVMARA